VPGAGTDKTKRWIATPAPIVILVESQLGENIGAAARAMANFGLSQLRLVAPKAAWPNEKARVMASGADRVLDGAKVFASVREAIADCHFVLATTARAHDQAKPVSGADEAARLVAPRISAGETVAILFGRERNGLENDEVALADRVITLPVNPAFASLNLAQAVAVVSYEWFKEASGNALPFTMPQRSATAPKAQLAAFFENVERELDKVEFFRPAEKRETMLINLRNIFTRMAPTQQDIQTLSGVILSIAAGRKGPAQGGILDGAEAQKLRDYLAEHAAGRMHESSGPARGLSRILRRNPTDAERKLWDAITKDRRLASAGLKRQVPVGPHIADLVSFGLRLVIDIVPEAESEEAAATRERKLAWLHSRHYRVLSLQASKVQDNVAAAIDAVVSAVDDARIVNKT
jgi:tRNA/rRNA methyltransferase